MRAYRKIVILTGAGISQESGIKTFRDSDGLWENHRIEDVASPLGFAKNPDLVLDFYNQRRTQLLSDEVAPNKAHLALYELEKNTSSEVIIITQNIDDLHERAGNTNVLHMHGELLKMRCLCCNKTFEIKNILTRDTRCPECKRKGHLRPDIVWFGEMPYHMDEIEMHLTSADLFMVIGTSGQVYPAAGFVEFVKCHTRAYAVEFNIDQTGISHYFDEHHYGMAGEKVKKFVDFYINHQTKY